MAPNPAGAADALPITKKRLALAITDFLQTSLEDGTVAPEDRESIEVATSCIGDAFKVDPTDKAAVTDALSKNQNLLSIFNLYEKLSMGNEWREANKDNDSATPKGPSDEQKQAADGFKTEGNVAMQKKDYPEAIARYSKAIDILPTNPIFLSNRAAAYSASKQHELAKNDAELAVASDPKFSKGWSRLGLARFALGDAKGSMEAYQKGMEAEGNGGSEIMKKGYETAKRRVEEEASDDVGSAARSTSPSAGGNGGMPDLSSLAGMFGGGGGGQGGGMPDLGALMNNPMMRSMAQNLMSNPEALNGLMQNPQMRQMAEQFGGGRGGGGGGPGGQGGSGPDLSALMSDPSIQEMARNFMGGAGRGGGAGGAA